MIVAGSRVGNLLKTGEITIDPYFNVFQSPTCYHCHLGNNFLIPKESFDFVDPLDPSSMKDAYAELNTSKPILLEPGKFILAEVFEYLGVSGNFVVKLLNSSSLARVGISQAALGMINMGCGYKKPVRLTLELINNFPRPIKLTPTVVKRDGTIIWGTEVLKIVLQRAEKPKVLYDDWKDGVYSGDKKVSGSKMAGRFSESAGLKLDKKSRVWSDSNER